MPPPKVKPPAPKPKQEKKRAKDGVNAGWTVEESQELDEYLAVHPNASADEIHANFPDKPARSVKAKLQYLRGGGFSKVLQ